MNKPFILNFISQQDFEEHVFNTIKQYRESLKSIDLKRFNKNLIDPIKLVFDKNVFNKTFEEIIELEILRQRDKTNNNLIGYFHQNIFKYIKNCTVPKHGWDIIFKNNTTTYYVELKNKHNTLNSSSSSNTFIKMQDKLLSEGNKNNVICALVEVIAAYSQDIPWIRNINNKRIVNQKIRRISIDKFYEIVTGEKDAFKNLCFQLPITIEKIVNNNSYYKLEKDSVLEELLSLDKDLLLALYKLAFEAYNGFDF
ncbi:Eco47II family restriction endonuclease [Mycoplasmopsis agalactiae]|uniref:Eco47II family restriction endonuclease n=1 Tax=Mycoplasmopsis agalactiae TaxID=2110 RepID=UPI001F2C9301|nr:Eco47II family restriction endonuclease [Mycoplasmopsis agalactiae]MCE6061629.1 Eco47II family restriction endonuclease [Mycoplasmopsis agalactiae]